MFLFCLIFISFFFLFLNLKSKFRYKWMEIVKLVFISIFFQWALNRSSWLENKSFIGNIFYWFGQITYGNSTIITILKEKLRQIGSGEGKPTERNKLRPHHHSIILQKILFKVFDSGSRATTWSFQHLTPRIHQFLV